MKSLYCIETGGGFKVSEEEVIEEIEKINMQLIKIHESLQKRETIKTDYSIVTIFAGFIPLFLFLISYFQANPEHTLAYFITLALFVFFGGASFIWAIIQIARAETPFTYSIALLLPLFVIFLPLLWSVLVTCQMLSVAPIFKQIAIGIIGIYAVVFFGYFVIELLYGKLIMKKER